MAGKFPATGGFDWETIRMQTEEHPTERDLVDGWAIGPTVRIRQARPEDLPGLPGILALAGVPLLSGVRRAVQDGLAGSALRAGLRGGTRAFHAATGPVLGDAERAVSEVTPAVSLVLVAESARHGLVGGLMALPPVYLLPYLCQGTGAERDREQCRTLLLRCAKIQAMAVTERARGSRIGAAMLHRCSAVYRACGHRFVYGQTPPDRDPGEYYRREGFRVLEPGEPLDLEPACGLRTRLEPGATERICLFLRSPSDDRTRSGPGSGA